MKWPIVLVATVAVAMLCEMKGAPNRGFLAHCHRFFCFFVWWFHSPVKIFITFSYRFCTQHLVMHVSFPARSIAASAIALQTYSLSLSEQIRGSPINCARVCVWCTKIACHSNVYSALASSAQRDATHGRSRSTRIADVEWLLSINRMTAPLAGSP